MRPVAASPAKTGSFADLETEEPFPGVRRKALSTERLTVSRYAFEPGATFPLHSHPQEQLTVVEQGVVAMTIGGSERRLEAGGWSVVDPGVVHGITAGADGARILAIVSPARVSADDYRISEQGGDR